MPIAFADLLRQHAGLIRKIAWAWCRDASLREDAVRYLVVGSLVLAYVGGATALAARCALQAAGIDYRAPVALVQQALAWRTIRECHAVKWAVLGGVVVWLPLPLLLLEALGGPELLAVVDPPWLLANALFGVLVLGTGLWWTRRHLESGAQRPWAVRLIDAVSGRALRRARQHCDEIAAFVDGTASPPAAP